MESIIFYNGNFIKEEDVRISPRAHALHYGTGCFEGIRAYYSEKTNALLIFRMREHFERLLNSAKILFINIPYTADELCQITTELLEKNFTNQDIYIRPLAFKEGLAVGNFNLSSLEDGFLIYTTPLGRFLPDDNGIKANVTSWMRVPDNAIPPRAKITGAYINTSLAKTDSLLAGFDEALFMDASGHIVEGSAENIFIVKNNRIYTPHTADDILIGITRDTILTLFEKELNIQIEERSIDRSEIYQADEIFLVGTGAEVLAVREVDNRKIGSGKIGPLTLKIKQLYFDLVHGELSKYNTYITNVKEKN